MNKINLVKFFAVMVFTLLATTFCSKSVDPVSQKMIDDIESIGDVTEEDEAIIKKLLERYSTLTDQQKEQVSNYNILLEAEDKIDQLFTIKAGGSVDNNFKKTEHGTLSQKEAWDITGSWCDNDVSSGRPGLAAYIDDSTITVYWVAENPKIRTPFWIGSYTPKKGASNYSWESKNNYDIQPYCVWASPNETKEFSYENGILCVPKSSGDSYLKPTDIDFSNGYEYIVEDNPSSNVTAGSIEFKIPGSFGFYRKRDNYYDYISPYAYMIISIVKTSDFDNLGLYKESFKICVEAIKNNLLEEDDNMSMIKEEFMDSNDIYKYHGIMEGVFSDTIGQLSLIVLGNPDDTSCISIATLISEKSEYDYYSDLNTLIQSATAIPDFNRLNTALNSNTDSEEVSIYRSFFAHNKKTNLPTAGAYNTKKNIKEFYHGFEFEIPQGWLKSETDKYLYFYPPQGLVMFEFFPDITVDNFSKDFINEFLDGAKSNYTPTASTDIIDDEKGLKGFLSRGIFVHEDIECNANILFITNKDGALLASMSQYDTSDEDYTDDFIKIMESIKLSGEDYEDDLTNNLETTDVDRQSNSNNGISSEFKAAMDSYEQFFDEYLSVMNEMTTNPSDLSILQKYTKFMGKYAETMKKFEAIKNEDMTPEEESYYLEVSARINQKLLKTMQ